ncbi:MAG: 30S ribosomal protein S18 [Candidatus Omnitrophica bacterium]|nr:30S ribosomal protein S18 [Candidatus Omnitrophota bacterium]
MYVKPEEKSAGPRERGRRSTRKKPCKFCADKIEAVDYKDVPRLQKFTSERGKILPGRVSGNCAAHQRQLSVAVKRARHIALLPFISD